MWVTKDDTGEQYTRLVINNMDNDAGDLNLTTADSAVVVGSSPSWFVSEITLVRKGALSFLPPAANVTSTFMVLVGTTNGDKSGKIRVDTRVSLNLLASPYTMLTPYVTKTYTQVGDWAFPSYDVPRFFVYERGVGGAVCYLPVQRPASMSCRCGAPFFGLCTQIVTATERRFVTETSLSAASLVLTYGDLLVAPGGQLVLPRNVTLCGGSIRMWGQMSGVQVFMNCTYPLMVTGLTAVYGCKSMPAALNYNPLALVDDGSCIAAEGLAPGCTYAVSSNYDPLANFNNGSCLLPQGLIPGCRCPNAGNFVPGATLDDGSCDYSNLVPGCPYRNAINYAASATVDDGSCLFVDVNATLASLALCRTQSTWLQGNLTRALSTGATCASNLAAYTAQYANCLASSSGCQSQVVDLNAQVSNLQASLSSCDAEVVNFDFVLQSCQLDVQTALALSQPALDQVAGLTAARDAAIQESRVAATLLGFVNATLQATAVARDACLAALGPCTVDVSGLQQQLSTAYNNNTVILTRALDAERSLAMCQPDRDAAQFSASSCAAQATSLTQALNSCYDLMAASGSSSSYLAEISRLNALVRRGRGRGCWGCGVM
jgi:hypothetical protein